MKETTKRLLSLVLCFVMVVGLLPALSLNADAAGTLIDAAIFCSDVHGSSSKVTSVFNGIKNADPTFAPTTASFVGDTQTAASSITSAAQSVFSDVQCIYAYGNHDGEGNYGISNYTGLSYGDDTTNYYIYTISESSMGSSNPDTSGFTSTVAGLDKSKPLFIISHLPLHSRRGDSDGAAVWYPAISAAAEEMDIFFFWAHNHTGEGSADIAAYYVAKDGSETITLEDTNTVVIPNFTYANAGYVAPTNNPARNNVATAVRIYDDSVNLTVYNAGGELPGTYAVNETVTREFASASDGSVTPEDTTPSTETTAPAETTPPSDSITGDTAADHGDHNEVTLGGKVTATEKKTVYVLSPSISSGNEYLIVNGNSAGSYYALANNSGSVDATGVTVKTDNKIGTYIELDDAADELWTVGGSYTFQNDGYYLRYSSGLGLSNRSSTTWSYSSNRLSYRASRYTYYLRYNNGWTTATSSSSASSIYFYIPTEIEVETTVDTTVTYTMRAEDLSVVIGENHMTGELDFSLQGNGSDLTAGTLPSGGSYSFTVLEDENGVIDSIDDGTVSFTGAYGTATVEVAYTWTADDGETYTVYRNVAVTATEPTYKLDITSGGTVVTGTTIVRKGVTNGMTLQLGTKLFYETAEGIEELDSLPEGAVIEWHIPAEYQNIAVVDHDTGLLTFKGVDGAFYVTATLIVGDKDYTVGVNISATTSQYSNPTDGTEDFPEFPNEGAIRFDKTGTAVGNFSETGIAQIELSMTGVPYTTGSEIDVVIMLDMTGSMSTTAMTAAEESAIAFAEQIVKNTDGSYNSNRVAVLAFNSGSSSPYTLWSMGVVTEDTWESFCTNVRTASDKKVSGGTPYDEALEKCQSVLQAAKTDGIGNDRQQFCVFVSDGGPTSYKYITNYDAVKAGTASSYTTGTASASGGSNQSDSNFATIATYTHEYYSTLMKDDGVTMYSVLTGLVAANYPNCTKILQNIASDSSKAYVVEDGDDTSSLTNAFSNIAMSIMQAATDVTVEDQITDEYTMIFDVPTGSVIIDGEGSVLEDQEFYIEFLKYALDENHERTTATSVTKLYLQNTDGVLSAKDTTDPVFEQKTIGDKGTLYYWSTNAADGDTGISVEVDGTTYYFVSYGMESGYNMTSGGYAYGTVDPETNMSENLVIATPYFVYNAKTRMLYWTVDKLDTYEYALRYFLYLNDSATEVGEDDETDPGSYLTNDHAYITYTNFKGNECRQEFPKPQFTWSGAQVSYVFYLVNAQGQPINKSGQVVDFANATFVTDIYTESTVWNKGADGQVTADSQLDIDWLANELLPSDYKVYDEAASYKLHVFGSHTGESVFDYFIIGGSDAATISGSLNTRLENVNTTASTVSLTTTKVYNTKAGEKVTGYGTYTSEATDSLNNEKVLDGFDFYNTTVAFAVVWQPALVPDVVVVDYGLDVLIDVVQNDLMQNTVTGIAAGNNVYGSIAMNTGVSTTELFKSGDQTIDGNTISIANQNQVRFHQGDMEFNREVVFYYESPVEYYEGSNKYEGYMYSSVTVIPATTIYYEDDFVSFDGYTWDYTKDGWAENDRLWAVEGTTSNSTQAQDRPGESQISMNLDADNLYGYDGAYANMSTYSNGSARVVTVDYDNYATAAFTFWGTGFDIISLTSNLTGGISMDVYAGDKNSTTLATYKNANGDDITHQYVVDTFYGYQYVDGQWIVDPNADDALYQVPVMKLTDLPYGQYTVRIKVTHNALFDHGQRPAESEGDLDSYDFYLDAIRIYDPANDGADSAVIQNAYKADGEGWPSYIELRNGLISKATLGNADTSEVITGEVFIDGDPTVGDDQISDYLSYGPNNEVYLASGQSIAFLVSTPSNLAKLNIGISSADGEAGTCTITNIARAAKADKGLNVGDAYNTGTFTVRTTTDMYYDLSDWKDDIIVIKNVGKSGIISLTNIKATYTSDPDVEAAIPASVSTYALRTAEVTAEVAEAPAEELAYVYMTVEAADLVLAYLNASDETEPEETEPETTVPEETEPETTVPEETEPETTVPGETEPEPDQDPGSNRFWEIIGVIIGLIGRIFG